MKKLLIIVLILVSVFSIWELSSTEVYVVNDDVPDAVSQADEVAWFPGKIIIRNHRNNAQRRQQRFQGKGKE